MRRRVSGMKRWVYIVTSYSNNIMDSYHLVMVISSESLHYTSKFLFMKDLLSGCLVEGLCPKYVWLIFFFHGFSAFVNKEVLLMKLCTTGILKVTLKNLDHSSPTRRNFLNSTIKYLIKWRKLWINLEDIYPSYSTESLRKSIFTAFTLHTKIKSMRKMLHLTFGNTRGRENLRFRKFTLHW